MRAACRRGVKRPLRVGCRHSAVIQWRGHWTAIQLRADIGAGRFPSIAASPASSRPFPRRPSCSMLCPQQKCRSTC